jgi:NADH-quinone oxidoreductase subunit G
MEAAAFVVMMTPFAPASAPTTAMQYADVLLPLAPFTETDGTFVNCEGRWQSFVAAVRPLGNARPGWKILRILGSRLGQPKFDYSTVEEVRAEIGTQTTPSSKLSERRLPQELRVDTNTLQRIYEVPLYRIDSVVRRAEALQQTADNPKAAARMNAAQAASLGVGDGTRLRVHVADSEAVLDVAIDARVPDQCVLIPAGYPETVSLDAHGAVSLEKAAKA